MVPTVQRFGVASGVAGILLLASVVAAQKLEVKTNQDPKADFKAIRTYAWLPPAPIVTNVAPDAVSNPSLSDEALRPHLIAAIDRQLAAHGLTKVDSDKADVHVTYFAALTTTFNQSYLGEHYGYITGWGSPIPSGYAPSTSVQVHEKGTVLVDLVDRAKKRAIWRATVVTRIAQEHTLEKRIERINEGAERIFQRFPIRAKK